MNATTTPVPSTFEAFMAEHDLAHDHPNLDRWRVVWTNELRVEATTPAVIPACPAWCTLEAGHGYTSYDGTVDGPMTHLRDHVGFTAEDVQVGATEHNTDGAVILNAPTAFVNVEDDLDAARVRALAGRLLKAAGVLDRITSGKASDSERTARARIDDLAQYARTPVSDEQRQAATDLLADLYAAGNRHGVDPEDWANVTAMPSAALDVVRITR